MTSKSWFARFAAVCGAISLVGGACGQEPQSLPAPAFGTAKTPAIALIDAGDAQQWQAWASQAGWQVLSANTANAAIDLRVQGLASTVREAIQKGSVDPRQIYLVGRGEAAAAVFYTISRVPDLWTAGVALGGSPQAAVNSDRIFTANFTNVPVLWVSNGDDDQALAGRLKEAGLNVEWQAASGITNDAVFAWMAKHKRDEFPNEIDCETNSPNFASCFWIAMTKFDAGERNDVLPSTRIKGVSAAALDLGGFGYKTSDPGPGVLVSFLPEKYSGPLKMGDRIVAIDGRTIEDAKHYVALMAKATQESQAVAMVERGKDRVRLETRIVLPRREAVVTARVEAKYSGAEKEVQIISRTIQEMRVTIPPHWAPDTRLYWNGLALDKIDGPCVLLKVERELLHAAKCQ